MDELSTSKNFKFVKVDGELESLDGTHKEISVTIMEDGYPRALAFFDIDKTLAELKNIHGLAIKTLFKEVLDKDFPGIEEVYFKGFKLGNSFREFDRMNGIYNLEHKEWIDVDVYKKERLDYKMKDIDSEGTDDHKIDQMYLDKYVEIAGTIADDFFKNHREEFENAKIKPIFALAKLYRTLGIPMFGMTANGKKFVKTIAKYLYLSDLFIDIATDEDMVGGDKEIVISKLIKELEEKGVKVSKEKIVLVGDSLSGDIGSGFKYKEGENEIQIKGILVVEDRKALYEIQKQIRENEELKKIIRNTDTEAFVVKDVPMDKDGNPLLFFDFKKHFLTKL